MPSTETTGPFSEYIRKRKALIQERREAAKYKRKAIENFDKVFEKYSIKRAYLFGSVLRRSCAPDSDIDIYVEDLEKERFWDMWRELEECAESPVDLYCQADDPVFIEKIKQRGELIYECRS